MEIKLNANIGAVRFERANSSKPQSAPFAADSTQFEAADSLNRSLAATLEVRADAVARAQGLISGVAYPPAETISRIAVLLAMHLDGEAK